MKNEMLVFRREEIINHFSTVPKSQPTTEARIILTFVDEQGMTWVCNKVVKCRLQPSVPPVNVEPQDLGGKDAR